MAVGLHGANLANKWLDMLRAVAFTAPTNVFAKLHTGDPGSAGTANASANTTRSQMTFSAASGGVLTLTTTFPSWASWASGSETLSHISVWDNVSAGNFLYSFALDATRAVVNGDSLTLNSHTISFTPLAA